MLTKVEERALLYVTGLTDKEGREAKEAYEFAEKSLVPASIVMEYTQSSDFLVNFGTIKAILKDSMGEPAAGKEVGFTTTMGILSPLPNSQEVSLITDENGEVTLPLMYTDDSGAAILPREMTDVHIVAFHNMYPERLWSEMTPLNTAFPVEG